MDSQQEIEKRFAKAMGDMLIDGYWSNTAYAPGQEELLYYEALGVMERLAKPRVSSRTACPAPSRKTAVRPSHRAATT